METKYKLFLIGILLFAVVGVIQYVYEDNVCDPEWKDAFGIQLSELQFLVHFGQNRPDYEVLEEIRISDPADITVTRTTHTWTLNQNGERIKGSIKITTSVDKYEITDSGKIEKIDSE